MSNISTPAGRQLLQWGIRKVVLLLVIVTAFAGLFGCSGKPEPPAEDLSVVSTSCGHMSCTESYSFSVIKKTMCGFFLPAAMSAVTGFMSIWRISP